ncbi:hypothetical protein [Deinococcus sp. NW-56]|uniref:hypothetical protein n=1 Tax=Deinococcus sp. NW-56 TaxID=2080419 RepID=UPI000CF3919F|nr:hypothetical protein [Deinococcus sp. NW-56]
MTDPTPTFAPGQRWAYRTRPGEEGSTLIVLRRETVGGEALLHVQLQGLRIPSPLTESGLTTSIGHLPIREAEVRQSVTELLEQGVMADDGGGYETWRAAHARGEAGFFTLPVSQIVTLMEQAVRDAAAGQGGLFRKSNR